jgi:hypothetical protein
MQRVIAHLLLAAFAPLIPVVVGLILPLGGGELATRAEVQFSLVIVGFVLATQTYLIAARRADYWDAVVLSVLFTLLAIPLAAIALLFVAAIGNSLGAAGDSPPAWLTLVILQIILTAPLILATLLGVYVGNRRARWGEL